MIATPTSWQHICQIVLSVIPKRIYMIDLHILIGQLTTTIRTPSTHLVVYHMALHHSQFSSTTHHNHQDSVKLMFLCPKWRSEIYRFLAINVSSKFAKMFKS